MIEIPEAVHLATQLTDSLGGRRITGVIAGHSVHKFAWFYGDPDLYSSLLTERSVSSAAAVGGMVEAKAEGVRLLFSEGVNLRFHQRIETAPQKHQLLLEFDDGSGLSAGVQMYGGIGAYPEGENSNEIYLAAKTRPSPLSMGFDEDYFDRLLTTERVQKLSVKAFLATEQRIPGLGNGVLQDILFVAGINPKKRVLDLTGREIEDLFASIKGVLQEMADNGGRNTEKDLHDNPGGYSTLMCRFNVGKPCPKCKTLIVKMPYMGGSVYFCPECQPHS